MSATQTQQKLGFASPTAAKLPQIACIGKVDEVCEGHTAKSGLYYVQQVNLSGTGANRSARCYFCYRPEWMKVEFEPNSLKGEKGPYFVYTHHVMPEKGSSEITTLQGLAGSEDRFNEFAARLLSIPQNTDEEKENLVANVQAIFQSFLIDEGADTPIGYKMKQSTEDTGEVNEKGYKIKVPLAGKYELGSFFYPTEKKLKSLVTYASRNPENLRLAFDQDCPF